MAGPSPGGTGPHVIGSSGNHSAGVGAMVNHQNVSLFYVPQYSQQQQLQPTQQIGNYNQQFHQTFHHTNQHNGGQIDHLATYMAPTSKYRTHHHQHDHMSGKVQTPTDNNSFVNSGTSMDSGNYWSYQQQQQVQQQQYMQQWNQQPQMDYGVNMKTACWQQQQQQQQQQQMQHQQQQMPGNWSCSMTQFNYNQQQQQQQQCGYRGNVVATVTLSHDVSRTSSRCDSVRSVFSSSDAAESNCSSGADDGGQTYGLSTPQLCQNNFAIQQYPQQIDQQQQNQQCFWPSSHYEVQNQLQHIPQTQPSQQQQQQLIHYFRQQQQQNHQHQNYNFNNQQQQFQMQQMEQQSYWTQNNLINIHQPMQQQQSELPQEPQLSQQLQQSQPIQQIQQPQLQQLHHVQQLSQPTQISPQSRTVQQQQLLQSQQHFQQSQLLQQPPQPQPPQTTQPQQSQQTQQSQLSPQLHQAQQVPEIQQPQQHVQQLQQQQYQQPQQLQQPEQLQHPQQLQSQQQQVQQLTQPQQQLQQRQFVCHPDISSPENQSAASSPNSTEILTPIDQKICTPSPAATAVPEPATADDSVVPAPTPPAPSPVIVPAGWTRNVSAGSVIYISPSGCPLASNQEAAAYVQRDGTCKCGLPCPLRLDHVFNFDPTVLNATTTAAAASSVHVSNCCRKSSLDVAPVPETEEKRPAECAKTKAVKKKKPLMSPSSSAVTPAKKARNPSQPVQTTVFLNRRSPCPNVDVRQLPPEQNRPPAGSLLAKLPPTAQRQASNPVPVPESSAPSFFEDPSAYLAQQTVLVRSSMAVETPEPLHQQESPDEQEILEQKELQQQEERQPEQQVEQQPEQQAEKQLTTEQQELQPEQTQQERPEEETPQHQDSDDHLPGDLLDCIPVSMEDVFESQKEKSDDSAPEVVPTVVPDAPATSVDVPVAVVPVAAPPVAVEAAPVTSVEPNPPATQVPAPPAVRTSAPPRPVKSRVASGKKSPRRTQQAIVSHSTKVIQPAQCQPQLQQQPLSVPQQPQQQTLQQHITNYWPPISTAQFRASFPFSYQSPGAAPTPIFTTAQLRPNNNSLTFVTTAGPHSAPVTPVAGPHVFNAHSLPLLTTRPALAPSGQLVHVVSTLDGSSMPILTVAPPTAPVVPLPVAPATAAPTNQPTARGLTRTGKKKKSTPQTVASILHGAQLQQFTHQQQPQQESALPPPQHQPQPQQQVVYNVQGLQHSFPQLSTLALMPDGKTYVVVHQNSAQHSPAPHQTAGHWVVSQRPGVHPAFQTLPVVQQPPGTLIATAPAGPAQNLLGGFQTTAACQPMAPTTTFVLQSAPGSSGPVGGTQQVLIHSDGTLQTLQTAPAGPAAPAEHQNSLQLAPYGGLFIRCPPNNTILSCGPSPQSIRTLQIPIAAAVPGRSPDSSVLDGVTSTKPLTTELVTCGEATPPQTVQTLQTIQQQQPGTSIATTNGLAVRVAQPSPVVQSSQIDSCTVQEDQEEGAGMILPADPTPLWTDSSKRPPVPNGTTEYNNNTHWLKTRISINAILPNPVN